jgi:hypothetical protein
VALVCLVNFSTAPRTRFSLTDKSLTSFWRETTETPSSNLLKRNDLCFSYLRLGLTRHRRSLRSSHLSSQVCHDSHRVTLETCCNPLRRYSDPDPARPFGLHHVHFYLVKDLLRVPERRCFLLRRQARELLFETDKKNRRLVDSVRPPTSVHGATISYLPTVPLPRFHLREVFKTHQNSTSRDRS